MQAVRRGIHLSRAAPESSATCQTMTLCDSMHDSMTTWWRMLLHCLYDFCVMRDQPRVTRHFECFQI